VRTSKRDQLWKEDLRQAGDFEEGRA